MVLLCSICDIVAKKIFSTFTRKTIQSHQTSYEISYNNEL